MEKILSLLLLCASFQSFADTAYIGVDYVLPEITINNEDTEPKAAALRLGVSNNNMAFEAQYLTSLSTDNIYNIEFDIEESVALFFVMQSDVVNGFGLDASLGYAQTNITVAGPEETINGDFQYKGFAWGLAIHQDIPYIDNTQIRLGYQSLYNKDDIEITAISLGFTYQF
ncbi:outer membrane beta-barrel protein [Pseudoalteromonas sp. SWXJZ94C]|uniref:outer membrane beta-barrel protein n=1 Tax=Pseudoalteromonas sp. SWXJZ94C TaxID=2792065 RepID=UPI0018CE8DF5|nr:outer membrane beta-barrel protein [Pseudoalteromonas sp. SWXJZ94C]MBH0058771.1 outer membrane beta-barrel protein [Pseudoalteromonas sp. SWXJZ94C]